MSPTTGARTATRSPFSFAEARLEREPYPHFFAPRALDEGFGRRLLAWFRGAAPWVVHVEQDFYEAEEMNLRKVSVPNDLSALVDADVGRSIAVEMGRAFGTTFDERIDVEAHKLVRGQRIRIHNDTGMTVSHRAVVQVGDAWRPEMGGLLLALGGRDDAFRPEDRVYPPIPNTAFGFAVSNRSHHAVTEIHDGERFTVVLSFRPPGVDPD